MVDNKNLTDEQKEGAMQGAMNVLSRLGINVTSDIKEIMESFINGDISQSEAMQIAKEKSKAKAKEKSKE